MTAAPRRRVRYAPRHLNEERGDANDVHELRGYGTGERAVLPGVRHVAPGELRRLRLGAPPGREVLRGMRDADGRRRHRRERRARHQRHGPDSPDRRAPPRLDPVRRPRRFTTLSDGRDAEETRELLSRYFELAGEVIGRYGGTVEKFIGDAVMAVWGTPIARENDAERAVRAALDLVAAVKALGPGLDARAGVLTGRGGGHDRRHEPGDGRGRHRQHRLAAPVRRPAGHGARRRVDGAGDERGDRVRAGGRAAAQGQDGAGAGVPGAPRRGRARRPRARRPARGAVRRPRRRVPAAQGPRPRHGRARSGPASCPSSGVAGIGKSRLLWELSKYLDGVVETVWWHPGRSPAYGEGITFWALGEMVRSRAGLAETDDEATTRAKLAETVARWVTDDDGAPLDRGRAPRAARRRRRGRARRARSCSRRGGRSSSGSRPRARSCSCSRTSTGPTRGRSTSSTTWPSGAAAGRSSSSRSRGPRSSSAGRTGARAAGTSSRSGWSRCPTRRSTTC